MSSSNNFTEIEYRQKIISKYDKSFTFISIKFSLKDKIKAQYQKGKAKFEIDPNTFSFVDKTGTEGLKNFELTNEELGLKQNEELFKNFNEIIFPEENDFRSAMFPDFPIWHIIVNGKDYQSCAAWRLCRAENIGCCMALTKAPESSVRSIV